MALKNFITVDNLGTGFEIDPVAEKINVENSASNPVLNVVQRVLPIAVFQAGTNAAGNGQGWSLGCSITRTGLGQWTCSFDQAHLDGSDYHASFTPEEQSNNRDTPDITIVQGSKSPNGFSYQITTGDNGGTADGYVDTPHTISVNELTSVVTSVALN